MNNETTRAASVLRSLSLPDIVESQALASHLHLSAKTVRRYFQAGLLPGRKVGGRWYCSRRELLAFLESRPRVAKVVLASLGSEEGQA